VKIHITQIQRQRNTVIKLYYWWSLYYACFDANN